MVDSNNDRGLAHKRDRGKNVRSNRSQPWENVPVEGYTRADGTRVKKYTRRSPA